MYGIQPENRGMVVTVAKEMRGLYSDSNPVHVDCVNWQT